MERSDYCFPELRQKNTLNKTSKIVSGKYRVSKFINYVRENQ